MFSPAFSSEQCDYETSKPKQRDDGHGKISWREFYDVFIPSEKVVSDLECPDTNIILNEISLF